MVCLLDDGSENALCEVVITPALLAVISASGALVGVTAGYLIVHALIIVLTMLFMDSNVQSVEGLNAELNHAQPGFDQRSGMALRRIISPIPEDIMRRICYLVLLRLLWGISPSSFIALRRIGAINYFADVRRCTWIRGSYEKRILRLLH